MICFATLFMESRGKPIVYNGKTLVMCDDFPTEGSTKFRFVFESCRSEWRQGALLAIGGIFKVARQVIKRKAVFWYDTAPRGFDFEISHKVNFINVRNVWDTGDGVMHSWHNGAAMLVESVPHGRRYLCNDGFPDDDLDDIVFRIERMH